MIQSTFYATWKSPEGIKSADSKSLLCQYGFGLFAWCIQIYSNNFELLKHKVMVIQLIWSVPYVVYYT